MNKDLKKIFNKAEEVGLTVSEKEEMRFNVLLYMEENPVRNVGLRRLIGWKDIKSLLLQPIIYKLKPMHVALIIALLFSGGTVVAAERALPGDVLYPVKVGVNEEVRSALTISSEAQAKWDARRAEKRLEEAEKLANSGQLNAENRANLEARFLAHAEAFKARAEKIEARLGAESSFRANSNFEAALKAHEQILTRLAERGEVDESEVLAVLGEVRARLNTMAANRANMEAAFRAEADGRFENAAQGVRRAAENKIREVSNFLARVEGSVSTEIYAEAKLELARAEAVVVRGDAEVSAESYGQAFASYQEAMRIAQKAKIVAVSEQRAEVRSNRSVDMERPNRADNANIEAGVDVNTRVRGPEARNNPERGNGSAGLRLDLGL
jgi:hypothetical protein